jgi:hypothetical protein
VVLNRLGSGSGDAPTSELGGAEHLVPWKEENVQLSGSTTWPGGIDTSRLPGRSGEGAQPQ